MCNEDDGLFTWIIHDAMRNLNCVSGIAVRRKWWSVACIVNKNRQTVKSRTKRTDVRQIHVYCFQELDQLLGEQLVLHPYVRSANRRIYAHPLTPRGHQGYSRAASSLSAIAAIGAYQEGVTTNVITGKFLAAHAYDYTIWSAHYRLGHLLYQLSYVRPL